MDNSDLTILTWNVRGLNDAAHRELVRETVNYSRPMIVCLQETKLSSFSNTLAMETFGQYLDSYLELGPRGLEVAYSWHGIRI